MRPVGISLGLLVVLAPLSSCVAFMKPLSVGDHCAIDGSTDCAACVRDKCQTQVDACCMSDSCTSGSVLADTDACGRGEGARCATALQTKRPTAAEESIRSCMADQCNAICTQGASAGPSTPQTWTCATPRDAPDACAKCIYTSCASALDKCCADSWCSADTTLQTVVGTCVSGDKPGCSYPRKQSESGLDGVVKACIRRSCADQCLAPFPHQLCSPEAGGNYCSCDDAEASRGPECSVKSVGGNCIIGAAGCQCGVYSCSSRTSSSGGCVCAFDGSGGSQTCEPQHTSSGDSVCCLKVNPYSSGIDCECAPYTTSCTNSIGEYSVASCDLSDVLLELRTSGLVVSSCSQ